MRRRSSTTPSSPIRSTSGNKRKLPLSETSLELHEFEKLTKRESMFTERQRAREWAERRKVRAKKQKEQREIGKCESKRKRRETIGVIHEQKSRVILSNEGDHRVNTMNTRRWSSVQNQTDMLQGSSVQNEQNFVPNRNNLRSSLSTTNNPSNNKNDRTSLSKELLLQEARERATEWHVKRTLLKGSQKIYEEKNGEEDDDVDHGDDKYMKQKGRKDERMEDVPLNKSVPREANIQTTLTDKDTAFKKKLTKSEVARISAYARWNTPKERRKPTPDQSSEPQRSSQKSIQTNVFNVPDSKRSRGRPRRRPFTLQECSKYMEKDINVNSESQSWAPSNKVRFDEDTNVKITYEPLDATDFSSRTSTNSQMYPGTPYLNAPNPYVHPYAMLYPPGYTVMSTSNIKPTSQGTMDSQQTSPPSFVPTPGFNYVPDVMNMNTSPGVGIPLSISPGGTQYYQQYDEESVLKHNVPSAVTPSQLDRVRLDHNVTPRRHRLSSRVKNEEWKSRLKSLKYAGLVKEEECVEVKPNHLGKSKSPPFEFKLDNELRRESQEYENHPSLLSQVNQKFQTLQTLTSNFLCMIIQTCISILFISCKFMSIYIQWGIHVLCHNIMRVLGNVLGFFLLYLVVSIWIENNGFQNFVLKRSSSSITPSIGSSKRFLPSTIRPSCFTNKGNPSDITISHVTYTCDPKSKESPCPMYGRCRNGYLVDCDLYQEDCVNSKKTDGEYSCVNISYVLSLDGQTCTLSPSMQVLQKKLEELILEKTLDNLCHSGYTNNFAQSSGNPISFKVLARDLKKSPEFVKEFVEKLYQDDKNYVLATSESNDDSDLSIAFSHLYMLNQLRIPKICYVKIFISNILHSLFTWIPVLIHWVTILSWHIIRLCPEATMSGLTILLGWNYLKRKRRKVREGRKLVEEIREIAYDRLAVVKGTTNGYASIHLRDEINHERNNSVDKREEFMDTIWPLVVRDVRADNRVSKYKRIINGKILEWWEWSSTGRKRGSIVKEEVMKD